MSGWTQEQWAQYLTPYRYEHCEGCGEVLSIEGVPMSDCTCPPAQYDGTTDA
jgi:hypothetical protein